MKTLDIVSRKMVRTLFRSPVESFAFALSRFLY